MAKFTPKRPATTPAIYFQDSLLVSVQQIVRRDGSVLLEYSLPIASLSGPPISQIRRSSFDKHMPLTKQG
jgi:hypothetical protein